MLSTIFNLGELHVDAVHRAFKSVNDPRIAAADGSTPEATCEVLYRWMRMPLLNLGLSVVADTDRYSVTP
jgi:hypothetical protein